MWACALEHTLCPARSKSGEGPPAFMSTSEPWVSSSASAQAWLEGGLSPGGQSTPPCKSTCQPCGGRIGKKLRNWRLC